MRSFARALTCLSICLLAQGCATIFSGTTDRIHIVSKPGAARIEVNGMSKGKTPDSFNLERNVFSSTEITLKKKGYHDKHITMQKKFNLISLFNILVPPLFIVDLATGALIEYSNKNMELELDKK